MQLFFEGRTYEVSRAKKIFSPDGGHDRITIFTGAGHARTDTPRHHKKGGGFIFEYVLSGEECVESPGVFETARVGDLIVINPSEECVIYSTSSDTSALFFSVEGFILEAVSEVLGLPPVFCARVNLLDTFIENITLFGKYSAGDSDAGRLLTESAISLLLRAASTPNDEDVAEAGPVSAEKIKEYLDLCLCADVELDDIGAEFGVSGMHIIRVFRGKYDTTPMQYLKEARLRRAAKLLRETDMSIREICDTLSFSTTQHFTNQFREAFGKSPGRFREESAN